MNTLQQLVHTRKDFQTYYDRPLSCDNEYSGISDDDSLSSSSSFFDGGRRDQPNGMAFGWFERRNDKPSSHILSISHGDDEPIVDSRRKMSERCNGEGVLMFDLPVRDSFPVAAPLVRSQGSDFSGVAFRRRRRKLVTSIQTRNDVEEPPQTLLQKCRSGVGGDPKSSTATNATMHLTTGQSALLLSQRRYLPLSVSKALSKNKCVDEPDFQILKDSDGVEERWTSSRKGDSKTSAPAAKTESVQDHCSYGSSGASFSMTEESISFEESSQQSEASLQILLRHIFSWEHDVWCQ
jgi:hypothetical protein